VRRDSEERGYQGQVCPPLACWTSEYPVRAKRSFCFLKTHRSRRIHQISVAKVKTSIRLEDIASNCLPRQPSGYNPRHLSSPNAPRTKSPGTNPSVISCAYLVYGLVPCSSWFNAIFYQLAPAELRWWAQYHHNTLPSSVSISPQENIFLADRCVRCRREGRRVIPCLNDEGTLI